MEFNANGVLDLIIMSAAIGLLVFLFVFSSSTIYGEERFLTNFQQFETQPQDSSFYTCIYHCFS